MLKHVFRPGPSRLSSALLASFLLFTSITVFAQATELDQPAGRAILEIVGKLEHTNSTIQIDGQNESAAVFDLALLESLPSITIKTETPWTEGVAEFTGVRMDVLLEHVGASPNNLLLEALDEYSVEAVDEPFESFPIVVAYQLNGEYMSVRELGPLWLMYPFDDHPQLNTEQSRANCVWQLKRIVVR